MITKHLRSYRYAFKGIWIAFRHEQNMVFHLIAAVAVIAFNYTLHVTKTDWLITISLIGVVWTSEIFNTAIERLADRITKEQDQTIGMVKDLAAGAVLCIGLFAAICAVIIYWTYLF